MKLTDESVAKALGWKEFGNIALGTTELMNEDGRHLAQSRWPRFTTSLDSIVSEIEARGLGLWYRCEEKGHKRNGKGRWSAGITNTDFDAYDNESGPVALCAALLAYLKEAHHD